MLYEVWLNDVMLGRVWADLSCAEIGLGRPVIDAARMVLTTTPIDQFTSKVHVWKT